MTEYKLGDTIGIPVEEAKEIIDKYFSKVPKVQAYLDKSGKEVKKTGVAYTMFPVRRPRYFDLKVLEHMSSSEKNIYLGSVERAGKNSPIQGTNADWVKLAICNIFEFIKRNRFPAKLRLTVHDEIVSSTLKEKAEEWKVIQERLMIEAGQVFIKTIPIVVKSDVGLYWNH